MNQLLQGWHKEKARDDSDVKVKAIKGYISYEGELIINVLLFLNRYFFMCCYTDKGLY